MRTLTAPALRAMLAAETDEVFLVLLTISHAQLDPPIRVVHNSENIDSRGNEFLACAFEIALPDDDPKQLSTVQLKIDNVDRSIVAGIRSMEEPATVTLEVVLASSPDDLEIQVPNMVLRDADYDHLYVTGTLAYEDILNESYPSHSFLPSTFPALF